MPELLPDDGKRELFDSSVGLVTTKRASSDQPIAGGKPTSQSDEKAGLRGMRYAPNDRRAFEHKKRRPAMKKISTVQAYGNEILKEQKLTIGVDLGDRWSFYCVLDEAGKIILEQKVPTPHVALPQR